MLNYATLFDINYLNHGLTMYRSLQKVSSSFKLFILCLDDQVYNHFVQNSYDNIISFNLRAVEKYFPELLLVKKNRKYVEYIFTLSPYLPLYIIKRYPTVEHIISMDSDLMFFSDPEPLINELSKSYSILITPHHFRKEIAHYEEYGKYNVSFQYFKNDDVGKKCLEHWKEDCINWCYDFLDGDKYADQKYLDKWPLIFNKVGIFQHLGIGIAPWNIQVGQISLLDNNTLMINEYPIIFYHFQGFRIINKYFFFAGLHRRYEIENPKAVLAYFYKQYIENFNEEKSILKFTSEISRGYNAKWYHFLYWPGIYLIAFRKIYKIYNLSEIYFLIKRILRGKIN